ncbi:MAG TPA: replicative DNA helicase [Polyangiaceae bacterium]|nr:replicative DNA helicase [Polyangiaceae bacterium]
MTPPGGGQRQGSSPTELRPSGGRVPPHDLDAEAAVLSAVMLAQEAFDRVAEFLRPEHFYSGANQRVFEAVLALQSESRPVDVITVAGWLRDRGVLQQVGGTAYLAQLTDAIPTIAHVETHGRAVREKWRLRRAIATFLDFTATGYGDCGEVQSFIDKAEQAIFDLARQPEASAVISLKQAIHGAFGILSEAAKRGGGITGFATGFHDLDKMTAGLHPGDLYIVAARPGMGKTSFVLNLAAQIAEPRRVTLEGSSQIEELGTGVIFFSLEMPREQLASRLLASDAGVDVSKIRSGAIGKDDWINLTESASKLGHLPLWLDDTPAIGLLDLRARVRRLQAEIGRRSSDGPKANRLGVVIIDYLQLMSGRPGVQSREQEISELSRGLKQLAKEMGVAVIALSQLNRSVETRTAKDKRPQLSDLRESGAIEQDADAIMFIYRDDYYFPETTEPDMAEIILAKQRNGPTGKVKLRFNKACTRFENRAADQYEFNEWDGFQDDAAG